MDRYKYLVKIFLAIVYFTLTFGQNQYETCPSGTPGICRPLRSCDNMWQAFINGAKVEYCDERRNIVCCNNSSCPTMKENVEKTGQKAWDKCIDLINVIRPCEKKSGYTLYYNICTRLLPQVNRISGGGGDPAENGEFPHMVQLGFLSDLTGNISWNCGGSLISERWVLTAAHCTYDTFDNLDVSHVKTKDAIYRVQEAKSHPDYIFSKSKYNDIALVKLNTTVIFSESVIPACLHVGDAINDSNLIMTGWGAEYEYGPQSNHLIKVILQKFEYEECNGKYPRTRSLMNGIDNRTQLCAGHRTRINDACQGDSGGPIQIDNTDRVYCTYLITGVTSFGKGCSKIGTPGIYTRVSAFLPWIESIVWP